MRCGNGFALWSREGPFEPITADDTLRLMELAD
jgi:hypothetical protein